MGAGNGASPLRRTGQGQGHVVLRSLVIGSAFPPLCHAFSQQASACAAAFYVIPSMNKHLFIQSGKCFYINDGAFQRPSEGGMKNSPFPVSTTVTACASLVRDTSINRILWKYIHKKHSHSKHVFHDSHVVLNKPPLSVTLQHVKINKTQPEKETRRLCSV